MKGHFFVRNQGCLGDVCQSCGEALKESRALWEADGEFSCPNGCAQGFLFGLYELSDGELKRVCFNGSPRVFRDFVEALAPGEKPMKILRAKKEELPATIGLEEAERKGFIFDLLSK